MMLMMTMTIVMMIDDDDDGDNDDYDAMDRERGHLKVASASCFCSRLGVHKSRQIWWLDGESLS